MCGCVPCSPHATAAAPGLPCPASSLGCHDQCQGYVAVLPYCVAVAALAAPVLKLLVWLGDECTRSLLKKPLAAHYTIHLGQQQQQELNRVYM